MAAKRVGDTCVVTVPDPALLTGAKLEWGLGNHLLLFASPKICPSGQDHQSALAPCTPLIHDIRWDTSLHNHIMRKLVNESQSIFLSVQKLALEPGDTSSRQQLVKVSRKYRSVLSACFENLQSEADATSDEALKNEYCVLNNLTYKIQLIWNLCEILFIDDQPFGIVLHQLLKWIRWHFTEGEKKVTEIMKLKTSHTHEAYWDAIYCFVLQGQLEEARKLLQLHPYSARDDFCSLDELLRKMPIFESYNSQSVAEFSLRWQHWHDECQRRLQNGEFSSLEDLQTVCQILCGDISIFLNLRNLCETWYHMLVSRLLYTDPCVKVYDLHSLAKECIDSYGGMSEMDHLDIILLAAMDFDLQQVIKTSSQYLDSWWFVAHLTDLLYHGRHLNSQEISYSSRLREFLLLEYATSLMSHQSLWQVGINYLDHCPTHGRQYQERYLERIPLESEAKALKVLALAQQRDLHAIVNSVSKVMGLRSLHENRLGNALIWAIRSKDANFASHLADRFLLQYNTKGHFTSLDMLDSLGSCMLVSDRLTFLGKYCEFHKLYQEKEFQSAMQLLVSLLSNRLAPKFFWMTLLLDALPLLESEAVLMDSQQVYQLMFCLEDLCRHDVVETNGDTDMETFQSKEKENLLRLALCRRLAKSFIST